MPFPLCNCPWSNLVMGRKRLRCSACGEKKMVRDYELRFAYAMFIDMMQQAFMDLDEKLNEMDKHINNLSAESLDHG